MTRSRVLAIATALLCSTAAWAAEKRGVSLEQASHLRSFPSVEHFAADADGVPTHISGRLGFIGFGPVERNVQGFVTMLLPLFHGSGEERFRTSRIERDADGVAHLRLEEQYRGLPIVGAELIVHVKEKTGEVTGVNGRFINSEKLPVTPDLVASVALHKALDGTDLLRAEWMDEPYLTYVVDESGAAHLAWTTRIAYVDDQGLQIDRVFANAVDGSLAARHALIWRAKFRKIYTANRDYALPGTLLFQEGGTHGDFDAQKAYEYSGNAYDYFLQRHSRDSWNGAGGQIISSVHWGIGEANAIWDGQQMAFGDGNTQSSSFARSLDVVGHEFTHGVTQATANLIYSGESGALNEAMSDIFGAASEARVRGVSANTWKIAEDIWTPGVAGDALRYMNNPTQDGSSKDYYPERYTGSLDNGGVHWNSGIANLAFYLLSQGGSHPRGKTSVVVPSIGILSAERIFYKALSSYMGASTNFAGARDNTMQAAADLFGGCSNQYASTQKAWDAVGAPRSGGREYEPNDLLHQANGLQPYSSYTVGYLCTSGNADWYVINKVFSYSTLSVSLYPPSNADFDFELYMGGSLVAMGNRTGNGMSENVLWPYGQGNFYIKVIGKNGAFSSNSYMLGVSQ